MYAYRRLPWPRATYVLIAFTVTRGSDISSDVIINVWCQFFAVSFNIVAYHHMLRNFEVFSKFKIAQFHIAVFLAIFEIQVFFEKRNCVIVKRNFVVICLRLSSSHRISPNFNYITNLRSQRIYVFTIAYDFTSCTVLYPTVSDYDGLFACIPITAPNGLYVIWFYDVAFYGIVSK